MGFSEYALYADHLISNMGVDPEDFAFLFNPDATEEDFSPLDRSAFTWSGMAGMWIVNNGVPWPDGWVASNE